MQGLENYNKEASGRLRWKLKKIHGTHVKVI